MKWPYGCGLSRCGTGRGILAIELNRDVGAAETMDLVAFWLIG
jgi:hypothetical protein